MNPKQRTIIVAILIVFTVVAGLLSPVLLDSMMVFGKYIPESDLAAGYVYAVAWAFVIAFSIVFWPVSKIERSDLIVAWTARCFVTLILLPLIESTSPIADAYNYYSIPRGQDFVFTGIDFKWGTQNIYNLIWIHNHIFPDSFHLLKVTWSLIGMLGMLIFYRAAILLTGRADRRVFYLLALTPSVLFWSSILGKDPIVFLGMSLYAYGVIAWYKNNSSKHLGLALLGILIVSLIRSWYGPTMVLPLLAFIWGKKPNGSTRSMITRVAMLLLLGIALGIVWSNSRFSGSFGSADSLLETTNTINEGFAVGNSANQSGAITSIPSLISNLPLAIFTALFRPLPGEVMNPLGLLSGIEGFLLSICAIFALRRVRRSDLRNPTFVWTMVFILLWAAQYGVTASGNLGSLVRYRLQALPFLIGIVAYLLQKVPSRAADASKRSQRIQSVSHHEKCKAEINLPLAHFWRAK